MGDDDDFVASTISNMTDEEFEAFCEAVKEQEREEQHYGD